ncbi:T6SS effector amidase Tae4 family protein [Chryseobacterium sp. JK1]|uniref:T6SS effector amidase Tae4 family protein n=1 Tax=Chryseobacterium sp. JK1 TaxID=874294 RepID=UPI003D684941
MRMSEALHKSKVDLLSFHGVKCWEKHEDGFKHFLRAEELAKLMDMHPEIFGNAVKLSRKKYPKMNHKSFKHKGIIFIKDGWYGGVDHIDLWNGLEMRGVLDGGQKYMSLGTEIWFWNVIS